MNKTTLIILLVLAVAAGALWQLYGSGPSTSSQIDTQTVARISQEVANGQAMLLDVRTTEEREQDGFAVGSTHFDIARLEAGELPDTATDTKVYTYCKSGGRAGKAETILEEAGFTDVENIGGLSDWEAAGGAVER